MELKISSHKNSLLAKEKGFNLTVLNFWTTGKKAYISKGFEYMSDDAYTTSNWNDGQGSYPTDSKEVSCSAPTQELLKKWIREERKVCICVYSSAGGWLWSMSTLDGTDLGYSGFIGDNESGTFDTYEIALENAIGVQLSYDLEDFLKVRKHMSNYADKAYQKYILKYK